MRATPSEPATKEDQQQQQQQRRVVCFSFAAYAKSVISQLRSAEVPISRGLSEAELAAIESSLGFNFPPDLRSILREGLPVGPGFPNWRSSSPDHLRTLLSFPVTAILNRISKDHPHLLLWPPSFGVRPTGPPERRLSKATAILQKAPLLVPIYRNFYIPSYPLLNGNPVFCLQGGTLKRSAFDLPHFFHTFFTLPTPMPMPAWAAKTARRVDVWSELADEMMADETAAGAESDGAWRDQREIGGRLREAGWKEEDVREMMGGRSHGDDGRLLLKDRESVMWHVRLLALALLRGGWSTEDVVYCMGSPPPPPADEEPDQGMGPKKVTWRVDPVRNEISMEL